MPIGNVTTTINDGALGIQPTSTANIALTLGTSSLGTVNTVYAFSDIATLSATVGAGPGPEAVAFKLALAGGPQYFVPVNASVAATAGSVMPARVATSTSVMTVTGAPLDAYSVIALVTTAGTGQIVSSGAVGIKYSLDGGNTYSAQVLIPAGGTYVIPGTGLSLVFTVAASATLDFGDSFSFTCTPPFYSAADVTAAMNAAFADPRTWGIAHLVGYPTAGSSSANATASAVIAVALDTAMQLAATNNRYARAELEVPPSTDANLISSFASFASTRTRVVAGTAVINSPVTGRQIVRSWGTADAARLSLISPSESPGYVGRGPIAGVVSLVRDERKTPGLFDSRFGVCYTIVGANGFYSDFGNVMANVGSDFSTIMNGRVMDLACQYSRIALLQFLNASVRVNSTTGLILEQDARAIETFVDSAVRSQVVTPGFASDCQVVCNRTDNILSTKLLRVKTRIVPLGYASAISEDIGFQNPNLVLS